MKFLQIILCLFSITNNVFGLKGATEMDTHEFTLHHKYPSEVHHVETSDGYLLEMHRIPFGRKSGKAANKPVFFLQHGLLCSSFVYVVSGPEKGLAFLLADRGYDVWMGNARGNTYSRAHRTRNPNNADFWEFSWHEIGKFDLPAMIDYVLNKTKQSKLYYAGHSQGTTAFFVMGSERPEYNCKIKGMFALAPIAFMSNLFSPMVKFIAKFQGSIGCLMKMIGVYEFMPRYDLVAYLAKHFCDPDAYSQFLCTNALFLIAGFNSENVNKTLVPIIMSHIPAGSSTMQFLHYAQGINSGDFRLYDFGVAKNLLVYKSTIPPQYNLKKVTAPVVLIFSSNDWMASECDVRELSLKLPNLVGRFKVPDKYFNHLDYMWGINAPEVCYQYIESYMKKL